MPYGFYLDLLSGKRAATVGSEERCFWNKDNAENFPSAEQATSLFAGKGQAATATKELNP
jgi:hypothetical protein